ncbi:MAG: helicase-related protein, partial [Candidatus Binatia bacterium]
ELRRRGVRCFVLTGQTQKREDVVGAFQGCAEPCVFLVSLKAGGTGLNLTAASYVVLFDPWWNPAVEAQAIDRSHRIGQTRTVMAYRLVAADTIEEKILELQRDKASLADAVVDDATFGQRLGKEDLAYLLEES